jgi:predicted RNA-binding protein associated with RNAse of E/G family
MSADFLLAVLRVERARLSTILADVDALGLALKGGLISPAQCVAHMHDLGIVGPLAAEVVAPQNELMK